MARKEKVPAEKWTAMATIYRRGQQFEAGDDLTEMATSAPIWAQKLLDAGKVRRDQVMVPVEKEDEIPPEEPQDPDEVEDPDIEHPPD